NNSVVARQVLCGGGGCIMRDLTGHPNGLLMKQLVLLTVMAASACLGTAWAGANVWTSLGLDGGVVLFLAIDPQRPSTVYAATFARIFKSEHGGAGSSAMGPVPAGFGRVTVLAI